MYKMYDVDEMVQQRITCALCNIDVRDEKDLKAMESALQMLVFFF